MSNVKYAQLPRPHWWAVGNEVVAIAVAVGFPAMIPSLLHPASSGGIVVDNGLRCIRPAFHITHTPPTWRDRR